MEVDTDTRMQFIHYRLKHLNFLPDIALIVGDGIHNLRSALDHAWFELIGKLLPDRINKHTKFPIRNTIEELNAAFKSHSIDTVHPGLSEFVRDDIKPYLTGNDMLVFLHDLDIIDKHRFLIPHANYGSIEGLKLHDNPMPYGSWGGEMDASIPVKVPLGRKIENTGRISLEIHFSEGPLKFMEVSEMLRIFRATVFDAIERMEGFLALKRLLSL